MWLGDATRDINTDIADATPKDPGRIGRWPWLQAVNGLEKSAFVSTQPSILNMAKTRGGGSSSSIHQQTSHPMAYTTIQATAAGETSPDGIPCQAVLYWAPSLSRRMVQFVARSPSTRNAQDNGAGTVNHSVLETQWAPRLVSPPKPIAWSLPQWWFSSLVSTGLGNTSLLRHRTRRRIPPAGLYSSRPEEWSPGRTRGRPGEPQGSSHPEPQPEGLLLGTFGECHHPARGKGNGSLASAASLSRSERGLPNGKGNEERPSQPAVRQASGYLWICTSSPKVFRARKGCGYGRVGVSPIRPSSP